MIIDCFPFYNELDVLEIRLNILEPFVDKFVLVESNKTQSGIDKPYYFEENKNKFEPFLDKIIHVKVENPVSKKTWGIENLQRNFILKGLSQLKINKKDIIAISDVDEIWNPSILDNVINTLTNKNFVSVEMDYIVFYLNLETVDKNWIGTVFTSAKNFLVATPQGVRNIKDRVNIINNGGWHFGYQGGKEKVYEKYFSCVEPFDKNLIPSNEIFFNLFSERIKDGGSFIFSDNIDDQSIKLKKYELNKLPSYIQDNLDKYDQMLIK